MVIETARLVIRRFTPDDWQDLYEYLSQPETVKYEPYKPFSPDEAKQEAQRRSTDENFYAIALKESAKLIGNIYLKKQDFEAWEIGFVFNSKFWSKGYATEAAKTLIDRAFVQFGAHRIFAECNPENEKSWKLLERLRFRREGHLTQNIFFKRDLAGNPLWQDTYIYGVLADEWRSKNHIDGLFDRFCSLAKSLTERFSVIPLLYGSLGLQRLLQVELTVSDIDVLLPEAYLRDRWPELLGFMETMNYTLIDEHEHTFLGGGIGISFAANDLNEYAGIPDADIDTCTEKGAAFLTLTLEQYLAVYQASLRDSYRQGKKQGADERKIELIKERLWQKHDSGIGG